MLLHLKQETRDLTPWGLDIRIFRSPLARYCADDVLREAAVYTDSFFDDLTAHGFNGIWVRVRLREVTRTAVFPEVAGDASPYRRALNSLCDRAARRGVGVYLYINEPLCFPADDRFWTAHPEVRGGKGSSGMDDWEHAYALCTSQPQTQAWLREACADLFGNCPRLTGVFTISASEHFTHCYSHRDTTECPRCAARDVAEVIAEVNNLIHAGISSVAPQAHVIAWNWSWATVAGAGVGRRIIERLQPGIAVMADFERGGRKVILGKERQIDEYSLSYVGPSERFLEASEATRATGRELFAKLQIGTTHEMATVNNLPLIPNLLGKARWLSRNRVDGALLTWCIGNRLTLNTWAFNRFLDDPDLTGKDDATVLAEVARGYLRVDDPAPVLRAWGRFVEAFDYYPFHNNFLYSSPVNYALVYPLPRPGDPDRPMPWSWIPLRKPYGTRLMQTVEHEWGHTGYSLEDYRDAFRIMADVFGEGLDDYRTALHESPHESARRELRNAVVIHHILRSTANIYAAYLVCRATPFDDASWQAVAADEAAHLAELEPLLDGEREIGMHNEEGSSWFFTARGIGEKTGTCR